MGLQENLAAAKQAIAYVASKMDIGASNQIDMYRVWALDEKSLFTMKNQCVGQVRSQVTASDWPGILSQATTAAERLGCGNCGEQSAIAFKFLERMGIRPIEFCQRSLDGHQFVMIGRSPKATVDNISTWGTDAVICDPWDRMQAYPAAQIQVKQFGTGKKDAYALHWLD
ncbi:MAG: hypothetical protein KF708_14725 [Pirellulales bacterium]|nr:hypothetical protein [Pirellulales bacterium]